MTLRIAAATARAVIDQIRGGGRSEMTLLLGENATAPGFTGDEQAVVAQLQRALAGGDPKVTADVRRHLSGIHSTPIDLAHLIRLGLEPGVVTYHALSMGGLAVTVDGTSLQITTRVGNSVPRVTFDVDIGGDVRWSTSADRIMITLPALPETLATAIGARIERDGSMPLPEIVSHPSLDPLNLTVGRVRTLEWGGGWLTLAPHPLLAETPVDQLLEERGQG